MKIAVIDLGTNTFNLLIAEYDGHDRFREIYTEKLPVKLGEGGLTSGHITDAAFERGVQAIAYYKNVITEHKTDDIRAFATSAVRSSTNGTDFVNAVKERTGISISVISGDQEAEFIAKGVRLAVRLGEEPSLIIDIGGGSTEFIITNKDRIFWKQSFDIGASRLLQKFPTSDPITTTEKEAIQRYLVGILHPLWSNAEKYKVKELIGASGSFESLAEILHARYSNYPDLETATECDFDLDQCAEVHAELLASTQAQRMKIKGLIAMRVDLIVISAIIVETVVMRLGITRIKYSAYSLKEGVIGQLSLDGDPNSR